MLKIDNKIISESSPTYIIAEIGINHKGNINLCKKMLLKAKQCGADAAKLQIVDPKFSYNKNTKSYNIFSKNKLNINELINLNETYPTTNKDIFVETIIKFVKSIDSVFLYNT